MGNTNTYCGEISCCEPNQEEYEVKHDTSKQNKRIKSKYKTSKPSQPKQNPNPNIHGE